MLLKRQLKEWADGKAGTDDVIKSVYDIAYNYIVDNGYVEQMFNSIKETAESEVKDTAKTVEVKPLMMALPFMAETTTSQLSGTKWYTVKYKGTAGY